MAEETPLAAKSMPGLELAELSSPSIAISVKDGKESDSSDKLAAYSDYLKELEKRGLGFPNLEIGFENLSYTLKVPKKHRKIVGLLSSYRELIKDVVKLFRGVDENKYTTLYALDECNGVIKPGTMTLVLAPPGHGKSTLLKALANKLEEPQYLTGKVYYNGKTIQENRANGVLDQKLVSYVGQQDVNLPLFTVKETFQFAALNGNVPLPIDPSDPLNQIDRVDLFLRLIGLKECENTIVGNDLIRGISGGQKKRVTVGESFLGNARGFFLDEVTTGLDSAVAYDVMNAFRTWATVSKGTVVAALLQPTPETFALFDEVILLRLGRIVYKGPIGKDGIEIRRYFESQGIPVADDMDLADFLEEFLTSPPHVYHRTLTEQKASPEIEKKDAEPPLSTLALKKAFATYQEKNGGVKVEGDGVKLETAYAQQQYGKPFAHSWFQHLRFNMQRQATLNGRNKQLIMPRIMQAIFMSLIMGTLFYQVQHDAYSSKVGLLLFACLFVTFGNMAEVPVAIESKNVVQKQSGYGYYPLSTYVTSVVVLHTLLAFTETILFGTILYWLSGLAPYSGVFIYFLFMLFISNMAMSTWFRFLAYSAPTMEVGQLRAGPSTAIFMLFAGFMITYNKIPDWLIWIYWLSPFSWTLRTLTQNEFLSNRYSAQCFTDPSMTEGECALSYLGFQTDGRYRWAGAGMTIFYFFLFITLGALTLPIKNYVASGTKRTSLGDESESAEEQKDEEGGKLLRQGEHGKTERLTEEMFLSNENPSSSQLEEQQRNQQKQKQKQKQKKRGLHFTISPKQKSELPYQPVTLTFSNIQYTVQVPAPADMRDSQGRKVKTMDRQLLRGITGYAKPKELTALMGASGAGKTTLMDVISGRTNSGVIEGEILINGKPKDSSFSRMMGYVEQQDLHFGLTTVREALAFSAKLRLPVDVTAEQQTAFVNEILDDLELTPFADTLVGDREQGIPGLSPGQLKRLTIGVELVANPSILFLDEPTSGLDSREALTVVDVIRRIARKGRTVVCTIHQPSKEVFLKFDQLILLQTGGHQVYFGEIGTKGEKLVDYFQSIQEEHCPKTANPASWMLEILAAEKNESIATSHFGSLYSKSSLCGTNAESTSALARSITQDGKTTIGQYASYATQYYEVQARHFKCHWRNLDLNQKRINLLTCLGIFFGLVYFKIATNNYSGLFSLLATFLMTSSFNGVILSATGMPVVARERAVFYREQSMKMYSPLLYSISIGLVEFPFALLCAFGFVTPFYFMVGLEASAQKFFTYLVAHYLLTMTFITWQQFLSEALPNLMVSNIVQGVFFSLSFLFGGLFIPGSNIPRGWQWYYSVVNWVPKCFKAMALSQLKDDNNVVIVPPGQPVRIGDFVVNFLDSENSDDEVWRQIAYLIVTIAIMRILVALAVKYVRHIKR